MDGWNTHIFQWDFLHFSSAQMLSCGFQRDRNCPEWATGVLLDPLRDSGKREAAAGGEAATGTKTTESTAGDEPGVAAAADKEPEKA